jgi:predicted MFS family arabinose efflux permease
MNRWSVLAALVIARTAIAFQFQSVAAVSPFLMSDLGLDYGKLGLMVGIYMLPGAVIALPGGLLGSRFGDKTVALCGLALMVAGGVMTGLTADYAVVLTGRLISGIGAVLLNVLLTKMASDWFAGHEMITAMAILVASFPLGIGLALALDPLLASALSWQAAFQAAAAFALVGLILVALVYRRAAGSPPPGKAGLWGAGFTRRELILVSLAGMVWSLYNVSYILLVSFAPPLLVARGLSAEDAGLATSLAGWTLIVSLPLGGVLIERSGRPIAAIVGCVVAMGLAIALVGTAGTSGWIIAATGFIAGLSGGAIMALPAQVLRPANRGTGMGIYFTWYYVGMALLPALAGLLRDQLGDARAPLLFAAALCVLTIGCVGAYAVIRAWVSPEAAR